MLKKTNKKYFKKSKQEFRKRFDFLSKKYKIFFIDFPNMMSTYEAKSKPLWKRVHILFNIQKKVNKDVEILKEKTKKKLNWIIAHIKFIFIVAVIIGLFLFFITTFIL